MMAQNYDLITYLNAQISAIDELLDTFKDFTVREANRDFKALSLVLLERRAIYKKILDFVKTGKM